LPPPLSTTELFTTELLPQLNSGAKLSRWARISEKEEPEASASVCFPKIHS